MVHFGKLCVVFSVKDVFMFIQAGLPCRWTSDGRRFILENFDVIRFSPQQVYNSAILLCPTSSWLHKHCNIGLSQEIRVVVGPAEWRTCIHSVSYSADSLACRNNTVAAAGHVDGRIDILDAITGIRSAVLSGHTQIVWDVAFSSDCTFLVSGSDDNTIRVWDIQTGGTIKMFYGHGTSVSVSVDDAVLASNSGDKLIYLWDIESEQCHTIEQDAKLVTFSQQILNSSYLCLLIPLFSSGELMEIVLAPQFQVLLLHSPQMVPSLFYAKEKALPSQIQIMGGLWQYSICLRNTIILDNAVFPLMGNSLLLPAVAISSTSGTLLALTLILSRPLLDTKPISPPCSSLPLILSFQHLEMY